MAQTQKAKDKETNQPQLEANQQTQTPPSRQVGSNQPQDLTTKGGSQNRGLARREQFTPLSPFSFMRRFSEEMDRLFEDFGFGGSALFSPSFSRGFEETAFDWSPQTEVFQRGGELIVRADLPGMTKDNINVDIEDDQIVIRGERRDEREESEEGFYHTERSYGSFYRAIPLPPGIDADQANAIFNNGVLEITLPLPEQTRRGRRLEIGESGGVGSSKQTSGGKSKATNQ
jgi:HSP20 family protein